MPRLLSRVPAPGEVWARRREVPRRLSRLARPVRRVLGPALEPTFLVIGAQKSGTTSLFTYLAQHPQVASPDTKEIDFFGCPARHRRGMDFYHSHFPSRRLHPDRVTFEASPDYLASPDAAERIHAYRAAMRLIVLVREPVERAHSAWHMYRVLHARDPGWFRRWATRCHGEHPVEHPRPRSRMFGDDFELDLREELDAVAAGEAIEMPVVAHGLYAGQLETYLRWFPPVQLRVERSEDLRDDPVAVLGRIEAFLGLAAHRWEPSTLRRELAGDYERTVPERARRLLAEVYAEPNRALGDLLGRRPVWPEGPLTARPA